MNFQFFQNPYFILGLLIRLSLVYISTPTLIENLYLPFLETSINNISINPWNNWLKSDGSVLAFPYGYVMWIIFFTPIFFLNLLKIDILISYWIVILIFDLVFLFLLSHLFSIKKNRLLIIYWLSPIIILTTYHLGFNDLIPISIFSSALLAIKKRKIILSSILLIAAISSKLSMILALPFVILYLFKNKSYKPYFNLFLLWLFIGFCLLHIPQLIFGSEALKMILSNREMAKIFELFLILPNETKIFIVPIIFTILFFYCLTINRINFEIFIVIQGLSFLITVLIVPSSLGWFLWAFPLIIYYQKEPNILRTMLVLFFSIFFVINSLLNIINKNFNFLDTFFSNLTSLIYTGIFTTGILLCFHIWKSTMKKNLPYQFAGKPLAIGIAGDSGSGKDTLVNSLINLFGSHSVVSLSGDNYHLWDRNKKMWNRITHLNPKANNLNLFLTDLMQLIRGNTISMRHYNHKDGKKSRITKLKSNDIIISSGLHALFLPSIRECYDLKIFLDMDENLRRFFKTQRDVLKRGHSLQDVNKVFLQRKEDSLKYILWQKKHADLVFSIKPIKKIKYTDYNKDIDCPLGITIYSPDGFDEHKLIRSLIGILGAKVDTSSIPNSSGIELRIEADPTERDIEIFANKVCFNILNLLDIKPKWKSGVTGIMQLITLLKIEYVINKRLMF